MYCTVYTNGNGNVIYINPNCNMKLIYEYLRVVTEIPDSKEIDVCTESGRLLGIYEAPCSASGLQHFKPRSHYFVLTFDYVEGSGELYNPRSLMHHTNRDFEAVLAAIKKTFGILPNEPVDDNDALLIFEHLLLAYQENSHRFSDSNVSSPSKRSDIRKKRSHSVTSVKAKGSKQHLAEASVLMQWREEKRLKLAAARADESEYNMIRRKRSSADNEHNVEESLIHESEEIVSDEQVNEHVDSKKTKGFQKRTSQTTGKKGPKKQSKKTGKGAKEDAKLQQAAPSKSGVILTPKPSFRGLLDTESALQLPPSNAGSGENLKALFKSKSSLFTKSDLHDPMETTQRRPYDSIRQFFKDHPTDMADLPKPPAADSNTTVSQKPKKTEKKEFVVLKRKKIVISRRSRTTKNRKRVTRK